MCCKFLKLSMGQSQPRNPEDKSRVFLLWMNTNMAEAESVTREKKPANLSPSAPMMIYRLPLTGARTGGSLGCPVPKRKKKKKGKSPTPPSTPGCQTLEA